MPVPAAMASALCPVPPWLGTLAARKGQAGSVGTGSVFRDSRDVGLVCERSRVRAGAAAVPSCLEGEFEACCH